MVNVQISLFLLVAYFPLLHPPIEFSRTWEDFFEMIPKGVLVMLVNCMGELMDNNIITEFYGKSHELDIKTDRITMTTAAPSGFLMATGDTLVSKTQVLCEFHRPMWEIGFCELAKFYELSRGNGSKL
jgi:hypothetical protein